MTSTDDTRRDQRHLDEPAPDIAPGQLVTYRTVGAGYVKAKVLRFLPEGRLGRDRVVLRVTSRTNPIYPAGYEFEASLTFTYPR